MQDKLIFLRIKGDGKNERLKKIKRKSVWECFSVERVTRVPGHIKKAKLGHNYH